MTLEIFVVLLQSNMNLVQMLYAYVVNVSQLTLIKYPF